MNSLVAVALIVFVKVPGLSFGSERCSDDKAES